MRVALLSYNGCARDAIGNMLAERVRFFEERGAEVRLFVEDSRRLHGDLRACTTVVRQPTLQGPDWDFLCQADLVLVMYGQSYRLLQWLPRLPPEVRVVFEYPGVTPADYWPHAQREGLRRSERERGYAWCADHVLAISRFTRSELNSATQFPSERISTLPPLPLDDRFNPEHDRQYWRRKLGIEGSVLLHVGRFAANKRLPLIIEALARLRDLAVHAVLVGDHGDIYAAQANECQDLAQRLGLGDRVHFVAPIADMDLPTAYASANALVVPSLHEGFCVPIVEAMACGVPVIAARSSALVETVGDAGLTFAPDDADDLARQLRRALDQTPGKRSDRRRVAIVSFRFGPEIVGGAETSLRTMASALQQTGQHVEVFTTCTTRESHWANDLAPGTVELGGLTVHRFPVDDHDSATHGELFRSILEAQGRVEPSQECRYLDHSIHSSALVAALRARRDEFDAIIVGPYLFGLTADLVATFGSQTLLVPCFHEEPLARLSVWPTLYSQVGGILYHSTEEQTFAQTSLGVHHPNTQLIGTLLSNVSDDATPRASARPYLVYCGRYSDQKNVPLLLDWLRAYQASRPGRFDVVFMGGGSLPLPRETWLRDLGRVDEATKRAVLAGASALVQLSTHESLSIVALEAWAVATPVIVHRDCPVLAGQVERSHGGTSVHDDVTFARSLDDLHDQPAVWRQRGADGRHYVEKQYASTQAYAQRLLDAIDDMEIPLHEQMRNRGLAHAARFRRAAWQRRFGEFTDQVLTQPTRPRRVVLQLEPLRQECPAGTGRTALLPVRVKNQGTHAALAAGPGQTVICCEARSRDGRMIGERCEAALSELLMPGQTQFMALPVPTPASADHLVLWLEQRGSAEPVMAAPVKVPLIQSAAGTCAGGFVDAIQTTLSATHELAKLPDDYVDVTEGWFATVKRFLKRKLLNNFKRSYVDVLSRRQSQVNGQVVVMLQQLTECCTMLDRAVAGLHQRLDALESRLASSEAPSHTEVNSGKDGLHPEETDKERSHG